MFSSRWARLLRVSGRGGISCSQGKDERSNSIRIFLIKKFIFWRAQIVLSIRIPISPRTNRNDKRTVLKNCPFLLGTPLSAEKLAEKAGLHRTYIGMIERAEKNITLLNIQKISKALGSSIGSLFNKVEKSSSPKER